MPGRGFEPPIFALRGRCPKPLDDQAMFMLLENGWGGRSRTLTYGTRNRCPAIRRHPSALAATQARIEILQVIHGCVKHLFKLFFKKMLARGILRLGKARKKRVAFVWQALDCGASSTASRMRPTAFPDT